MNAYAASATRHVVCWKHSTLHTCSAWPPPCTLSTCSLTIKLLDSCAKMRNLGVSFRKFLLRSPSAERAPTNAAKSWKRNGLRDARTQKKNTPTGAREPRQTRRRAHHMTKHGYGEHSRLVRLPCFLDLLKAQSSLGSLQQKCTPSFPPWYNETQEKRARWVCCALTKRFATLLPTPLITLFAAESLETRGEGSLSHRKKTSLFVFFSSMRRRRSQRSVPLFGSQATRIEIAAAC